MTATLDLTRQNDVADRDGLVWCRIDDEPDLWYLLAHEDTVLPTAQLAANRGPLRPVVHARHNPPGPYPSPLPGVCGRCGGTGVVHGPGGNGNWTDEACDCDTPYCNGCRQTWPCYGADEEPAPA